MRELAEDPRAVPLHRVAARAQRFDPAVVVGLDEDPCREARGRVDHRRAGDDQADPVSRALLLERDLALADAPQLHQGGAHRRLDDPVPDLEPSDRPGREEVRELILT